MFICHLCIFFGEMYVHVFFLLELLLYCWVLRIFYDIYPRYRSFVRYVICKYFLPICRLPFHPLFFFLTTFSSGFTEYNWHSTLYKFKVYKFYWYMLHSIILTHLKHTVQWILVHFHRVERPSPQSNFGTCLCPQNISPAHLQPLPILTSSFR